MQTEAKLADSICETWKPINGYEGNYEVSNFGNVRTLRRQGSHGGLLKQQLTRKGYLAVSLCRNNHYKRLAVHRLVAITFISNPMNYPCVNHKDENKLNNCVDNLEWCTYQYNNSYGTCRQRTSESKYKPCVGRWPNGIERVFPSCTIAARETGLTQGNIWSACNTHHRAGGIEWKYE